MSMNLMDVREAIVAILNAEMAGWQGYPYLVDQFQAPAFFVADPVEWNYAHTFDNGITFVLPVRFAVPRADEQGAHEIISALLSTEDGSPYDIFSRHADLNNTVDSMFVARAGRIAHYRTGGGDAYIGFELELEIVA
jgi:hypothetical protein